MRRPVIIFDLCVVAYLAHVSYLIPWIHLLVGLALSASLGAWLRWLVAIRGHRITVSDSTRADFYELGVMRQASELLPVRRQLERDLFGVSTS